MSSAKEDLNVVSKSWPLFLFSVSMLVGWCWLPIE
jgi:hypothetical protein